MRSRLIGFIPLGKRLLTQRRLEDERQARKDLRPSTNNVRKIGPAAIKRSGP